MRPDYRPRCVVCGGVIRDEQEMADGILPGDVIAAAHQRCERMVREVWRGSRDVRETSTRYGA